MEMAWEYPIPIYLFLAGTGAGAFLAAVVTEVYSYEKYHSLTRAGAIISGPIVAISTMFLVLDLGAGKEEPWRLPRLLANPGSPMTWGTVIVSAFIFVALIYGSFEANIRWPWKRARDLQESLRRYRKAVILLGAPLAVAVTIYTGILIGVVPGVPLWNTTILPMLFVSSALSSGLAAAAIGGVAKPVEGKKLVEEHFFTLNQVHSLMIVVELLMIFSWIFIAGSGSEAANESVQKLLSGNLSLLFWVGVVFFGIIDPLVIIAYEFVLHRPLGPVGSYVSDGSVLVGGFILRYLVISAAVPISLL